MGYLALLFCPDEKLVRVISQVFADLDFTVEPVHEPFAAVKKLMTQRYDAIVVDGENEQNASLLFKSARNSSSNQSSLAIALVEGQLGVAKAYRIGANLVLTKPINVEQAKGTLRVARGLLRKHAEAGNTGNNASIDHDPAKHAPLAVGYGLQHQSQDADAPTTPEVAPALAAQNAPPVRTILAAVPSVDTPHTSSLPVRGLDKSDASKGAAEILAAPASGQSPGSRSTSAPGSAAAPASAKQVTATPAKTTLIEKDLHASHADAVPTFSLLDTENATSSEAMGETATGGSRGKKQLLTAAVVALALAALIYFGYGKFDKPDLAPTSQPVSASPASDQLAPAIAPTSPTTGPSTSTPASANAPTPSSSAPHPAMASGAALATGATTSQVIRIAINPEPAATPAPTKESPRVVIKANAPLSDRPQTQAEEPAQVPSPLAVASANDVRLSGLIASASSSVPRPALATVKLSQGVSQGLLIKRVQPKYPSAALAIHAEGAVQIEATITKDGNVTQLKVLHGEPVLASAALDAVRQWRYKPYYLDGEPVEVQTQITVNYKAH